VKPEGDKVLEVRVFCDGEYKPFGEMTVADARLRSEELREAGSWGPLAKVASVALAWRELASEMTANGSATVSELDSERALDYARQLWVVPPRGSLL
jgi:hypothetical protein